MSSSIASITIAGEREIVELIRCATGRLVVMAPAVTKAVADAIGDRLETIGKDQVAVILISTLKFIALVTVTGTVSSSSCVRARRFAVSRV